MECTDEKRLVLSARAARLNSYSPYSGFSVGAALLAKNGKVYMGANAENASYGAAICAERAAFVSALSAGEREFSAIAVAGGKKEDNAPPACTPCGICLQFMSEFCGADFPVLLACGADGYVKKTFSQLFPEAFALKQK